jgi:4-hydroxybutyryl-CoA dehydratase / vinylacetyl-CoA-Delta-isomerase
MPLKTGAQYIESLRQRKPLNLWLNGELVTDPTQHPIMKPSINSVALTYDLAHVPEYSDVMTATSALTGKTINRFCHLHQSTEDLMNKTKMQRLLGFKSGTCFQRCVGMDAFNASYITTFNIDKKHNTTYHARFSEFLKYVEENDLIVDGAMTDPKGDRSKRPSDQVDPDLYVHVVERRPDGVVIRGAKAHQTGAVNSHELLVMPTCAISCAVPVDHENIVYIYGRQASDERRADDSVLGDIDCGNAKFGSQECLVVFEDVFVPNDRIFMNGEYEFAGMLVDVFAGYHRQSYGGCKSGMGDNLIGAAQCIAEYNGVEKASHIKDKIIEMTHLNETIYSCGIACGACGSKTEAGPFVIDMLMANVCKQNVTRFPYEIARLLQDIAGGNIVTLPSAKDFANPKTKEILEKYYAGIPGLSVEDKIRMLRFIENLTIGRGAVGYLTESMHGAGSPQAQRILISRLSNIQSKKEQAKKLAGIKEK